MEFLVNNSIIRSAIFNKNKISFIYTKKNGGVSKRIACPLLIFRYEGKYANGAVYVSCFCQTKQSYRTFLLNRMRNTVILDESFDLDCITLKDLLNNDGSNGFKLSSVVPLYNVPELILYQNQTNTSKVSYTSASCENCFYRFDCINKYLEVVCGNYKTGPTKRPEHWPKEMLFRYINNKKRKKLYY